MLRLRLGAKGVGFWSFGFSVLGPLFWIRLQGIRLMRENGRRETAIIRRLPC